MIRSIHDFTRSKAYAAANITEGDGYNAKGDDFI